MPSQQAISQKTTEFRQKAFELVGYKGIIGASLVILGTLGLAWWRGLFGGVKQKTEVELAGERDFGRLMVEVLDKAKTVDAKTFTNFSNMCFKQFSLEVIEDLPLTIIDKRNGSAVIRFLQSLSVDKNYKTIHSYLVEMIILIAKFQQPSQSIISANE